VPLVPMSIFGFRPTKRWLRPTARAVLRQVVLHEDRRIRNGAGVCSEDQPAESDGGWETGPPDLVLPPTGVLVPGNLVFDVEPRVRYRGKCQAASGAFEDENLVELGLARRAGIGAWFIVNIRHDVSGGRDRGHELEIIHLAACGTGACKVAGARLERRLIVAFILDNLGHLDLVQIA